MVKGSAHGFVVTGTDGRTWSTIVLPLPYGATGVLQQVAIHDNRVVALGMQTSGGVTTPLAELSTDGGATFAPVPFGPSGPDPAVTALTADAGGFTAAVQAGTPGQQQVTIWTSPDGTTWTQPPGRETYYKLTALAPTGPAVTAIGAASGALSQQPVVLTLPDR